jgi:Pvc16 N-terminal domain
MFQDLDTTLAELLKRELPSDLVSQMTVSFATPDSQFIASLPSTQPTVNLFLYEIQENRDLRTLEPLIERDPATGKSIARSAPVRVDCHYLVTAWASSPNPEQDEHRLLGEVMRVLLRYRELPNEVLRGTMKQQSLPLRAGVLLPSQQQTRGDFWQALGGKPRAAFNYTITIAIDVHGAGEIGRPVTSVQTTQPS